ncbi:EamA family transporter RarD [Pseudanabaena sp. PCC 6802]|uniref:EamA family transporter RarD n=1 Tax=Pseudanabaena sp. PCC 6802 TaxID=118173 RepID=UPI0003472929|nr:EamA family transporter RarD [Pseudanabaena sp. PCC 6802]
MNSQRLGILYAVLAYGIWGLFPIYWKLLDAVPATEILSHRVIWSGFLLLGIVTLQNRRQDLAKVFYAKQWLPLFGSASILAFNWGLYIYGVNSDRVVETSLGYFINPLVNVLLGVIILRERLFWGQWMAVILAGVGVGYSIFSVGQVPWIALGLAFSFGFYGLSRKSIPVPPLLGLTVETCLLTPVALIYLAWQDNQQFGGNAFITLLLIGCGVVTSVPLFCFSSAVQILQLSTMGFFQYIAPSLQLMLGVWLYREPFTKTNAIAFGCIWTALALYSGISLFNRKNESKSAE